MAIKDVSEVFDKSKRTPVVVNQSTVPSTAPLPVKKSIINKFSVASIIGGSYLLSGFEVGLRSNHWQNYFLGVGTSFDFYNARLGFSAKLFSVKKVNFELGIAGVYWKVNNVLTPKDSTSFNFIVKKLLDHNNTAWDDQAILADGFLQLETKLKDKLYFTFSGNYLYSLNLGSGAVYGSIGLRYFLN